jgi:hypothetical protein
LLCASTVYGADLKITVSENLPPPITYTQEVKAMTDAQFFDWATAQNVQAKRESEERSRNGEPRYFLGSIVSVGTTYQANGYYRRPLNSTTTVEQRTTQYNNPQYTGPGPLTIINPYCRFKD